MRGLRGDFLSVAAVLAVPLGLAAVFPREAIGFSASDETMRASDPSASIVFLDSASIAQAMSSARILSKNEGDRTGINLLSAELPGAEATPMMASVLRSWPEAPAVVEAGIPPFQPSRRAAAPVRISGGRDADALPFSRNELLKLN